MRPEIAKVGGFEGAEALRIRARMSFCWSFGKNDQKIWANVGWGVLTPISPLLAMPLVYITSLSAHFHVIGKMMVKPT